MPNLCLTSASRCIEHTTRLTILMVRFLISFAIVLLASVACHAQETFGDVLQKLDEMVDHKEEYRMAKRQKIEGLKHEAASMGDAHVADVYKKLYDAYSHLKADSALFYLESLEALPSIKDSKTEMAHIVLDKAEMFAVMGDFNSALPLIKDDKACLDDEGVRIHYYHVCRTVYGWMAGFTKSNKALSESLLQKTQEYRDSIIRHETNEVSRLVVMADNQIQEHHPEKAREIVSQCMGEAADAQLSYSYFILSESYREEGDRKQQMLYLAKTAMEDFERGVTEYSALPMLASLLLENGDVERAYKYMLCSMDDAAYCNARLRAMEVNEIFPIIEKANRQYQQREKQMYNIAALGFALFIILLVCALCLLWKENNKVAFTRNRLALANKQLEEANKQLEDTNRQLEDANRQLGDANEMLEDANEQLGVSNSSLQQANTDLKEIDNVKEHYISLYMGRSRNYIDSVENFRRSLLKMAKGKQHEEMMKSLKNEQLVEDMQQQFYSDFDNAFLEIHPKFVERFNALFKPEDRITPKRGEKMCTELRIFALIRMGIDDTTQIAHFLNYSIPTIYNYRSRIRNKSIYGKEEFENKLMEM